MPVPSPILAVVGAASPSEKVASLAFEVGCEVGRRKAVLVCGGGTGVMEEAATGARQNGATTIGILPGASASETPPNPSIEVTVFTGMGQARNLIVVLSAHAVIAVGGGWGTLSEIALAAKHGRPIVLLESWDLRRPEGLLPWPVTVVDTPREAVAAALDAAGGTSR